MFVFTLYRGYPGQNVNININKTPYQRRSSSNTQGEYGRKTKIEQLSMVLHGSNTIYSLKMNYRVQKGKSGQVYASSVTMSQCHNFHQVENFQV